MVSSLERWSGKVAIVTGASSGIGASIAQFLAENGLIVVGLARRCEKMEQNFKEKSLKIHALKTDISNEEEIVEAFQWVEKNLGPVHVLINCAGISTGSFLNNGDSKIWTKILQVNILGLSIATREAVKMMIKNQVSGHIIHINSIAGHKLLNISGTGMYSASKHAVTALAGSLKCELNSLKTRIKVTSLSPGLVESEMTTLNTEYSEKRINLFKKMPLLKPEDIANAVGYILSTPENVQIDELTITPLGETI